MAGKTVSAYADEETARRVEHAARVEQRPVSQIASAALAFYARLPAEAHAALRAIEAHGGTAALDRVARTVTRRLLDAQYEFAVHGTAAAIPDDLRVGLGSLDTEADLIAVAVRLTAQEVVSRVPRVVTPTEPGEAAPRTGAAGARRKRTRGA